MSDADHSTEGNIKRIIHHINKLNVQHLTIECTTPDQVNELAELSALRSDFEIGFGCVSCEPGHVDSVEDIVGRVQVRMRMRTAKACACAQVIVTKRTLQLLQLLSEAMSALSQLPNQTELLHFEHLCVSF